MKLNIRHRYGYALLLFIVAMLSASNISGHKTPTLNFTKVQQLKEFVTPADISSIGLPQILLQEDTFNDLLDNNDSKTVFLHASLQKLSIFFLRLASSMNISLPNSLHSVNYIPLYILFQSMRIPYSTN